MQKGFFGSLFGLAIGDALGSSIEFQIRDSHPPITDLIGGGPYKLEPGQWTDDTSLALCTAKSFIDCGRFDPEDQMNKYHKWLVDGYMSSNGICFDIGETTLKSIEKWGRDKSTPYTGNTSSDSAGNGSIMRLAPIPIFFFNFPESAIEYAALNSKLTHGSIICLDACRYMTGVILGAMQGQSKTEITRARYHPVHGQWKEGELHPFIEEIANGSYKDKKRYEIASSGWVVHTLEAALWAFYHSNNFKESILKAVNLGEDADTVGAVNGQIAGAYYGGDGIPKEWIINISHTILLADIVTDLINKRK